MLVNTMTPSETNSEIVSDWKIVEISQERLVSEYDRERRRFRVKAEDTYSKAYQIKSRKKNTWLLIFSKAPSVERYKGQGSINICALVYYYDTIGLRVFKIMPTGGLSVYNGHLFSRYNERMNLGLTDPLEIVKLFFFNNGYFIARKKNCNGRIFTTAICKEGLLLGELEEHVDWIVHKTFITRILATIPQDEVEKELLFNLQQSIEMEINTPSQAILGGDFRKDVYRGIK